MIALLIIMTSFGVHTEPQCTTVTWSTGGYALCTKEWTR